VRCIRRPTTHGLVSPAEALFWPVTAPEEEAVAPKRRRCLPSRAAGQAHEPLPVSLVRGTRGGNRALLGEAAQGVLHVQSGSRREAKAREVAYHLHLVTGAPEGSHATP
jgi:hypothetical protein